MYLYTSVPRFKTKRGYGCYAYRRGLSALFVLGVGHCEGLEYRTDEGKIPTSFLYNLSTLEWLVRLRESGGTQKQNRYMVHVGQLIADILHEQGRTVTWFATQLCCTRPNVYKIFQKENIDIYLLWRISCILDHDFFHDLSNNINSTNFTNVSK